MKSINPYLIFPGNCREAIKFYEQCLGGVLYMTTYGEMPNSQVSGQAANLIIHARLTIKSLVLMASDSTPDYPVNQGDNCWVNLNCESVEEIEKIYKSLSQNAKKITMPLQGTEWAVRFGMITDQFGVHWMFNLEKPMEGKGIVPFVISRTFDAPRELMWKLWTDPEHMQRWFGPKGFTGQVKSMDFRPGGMYHYFLKSPDGKIIWGKCNYREITPPEKLVWINSFSDEKGGTAVHPMSPTWPKEMLTTVTFAEHAGKTGVTVQWIPINASTEERETFELGHESMKQGWSGTFDWLVEYLKTLPTATR